MSFFYDNYKGDGNFSVPLEDGRVLNINVTNEGVIMDVYENYKDGETGIRMTEHLGTVGMTFDEWADDIVANDVVTMIGHT